MLEKAYLLDFLTHVLKYKKCDSEDQRRRMAEDITDTFLRDPTSESHVASEHNQTVISLKQTANRNLFDNIYNVVHCQLENEYFGLFRDHL